MNITFINKRVEKIILDASFLKKNHQNFAKILIERIQLLDALINVQELFNYGIGKPHLLKENFAGRIAWNLNQNYRLILKIEIKDNNNNFAEKLTEIETICIEGVCDYHGNKNNWIIP